MDQERKMTLEHFIAHSAQMFCVEVLVQLRLISIRRMAMIAIQPLMIVHHLSFTDRCHRLDYSLLT
jgi:hypothetical protein